jgi:hypothetical protein
MHAINVPTPTTCSSPIKPDISTISSAVQRGFKFGRRHSRFVNQGFFCNGAQLPNPQHLLSAGAPQCLSIVSAL